MTISELLQQAASMLRHAHIDTAVLDARLLMRHVLGVTREQLLLEQDRSLRLADRQQFEALVARRVNREPMAQILGRREFWGLDFKVTKDTLDPRPDSETLIEALLECKPNRGQKLRILDLGTGTGCLLLSALSEYPQATGVGVDMSSQALEVARENAASLGFTNRAEFKKSDWNSEINGVWDVVLGNPPYIPTEEISRLSPEVAQFEPHTALDGGGDGLQCYLRITRFLPEILADDGVALLEVGAGQASDVAAMALDVGLNVTGIAHDLAGIGRCVMIQNITK